MRKFIAAVIVLVICDFLAYRYLIAIVSDRKAFSFNPLIQPLIIQKKLIVLDTVDDFCFEDFFIFYSFSDPKYRYEFRDNRILIQSEGIEFQYPYCVREAKTELVEKTIYKEVYIEKPSQQTYESSGNDNSIIGNDENEYFVLIKNSLSFPLETEISEIIKECQRSVDTDMQTAIDYSELNPNQIGQYAVYFYTKTGEHRIIINII